MTAANSANQPQDELMPAQEKLEWVTPKISLMEAGDTDGKVDKRPNTPRPSQALPDRFYLKPRHTYKNQSSQRVLEGPFFMSGGHLRH
jgi:hypothetical protein